MEGGNQIAHFRDREKVYKQRLQSTLADIKYLDLSDRLAPFNNWTFLSGGACGEVYYAACDIPQLGQITVAIKSIRFYLRQQPEHIR